MTTRGRNTIRGDRAVVSVEGKERAMGGELDQRNGRLKGAGGVLMEDDRLGSGRKLDQGVGEAKGQAEGPSIAGPARAVDDVTDALIARSARIGQASASGCAAVVSSAVSRLAAGVPAMISRRCRRVSVWTVALLAAGVGASCGPLSSPSSQQPVQASNPSVTYNYRTDQELLQANQNATTYCAKYQTAPRSMNITNNPDGSKAVSFECVPSTLPVPAPASPNLSYNYRTDQELVQASQTAGTYCQKYGSQPMTSTMVTNADGTKTVTFQCGLR
jgi:hypothetical protein